MVKPGEIIVIQAGLKFKVRSSYLNITANVLYLKQVSLPDGPSRGCKLNGIAANDFDD